MAVEFVEITAETWPTFEALFEPAGGVEGGCWCAYFRQTAKEFRTSSPADHKRAMHAQVEAGEPFGIVALVDDAPSGWVAVSPRRCNPRLIRSVVARVEPDRDLSRTWSVTCFYIPRENRRQGLGRPLVDAAVEYARRGGAAEIEAYPVDTSEYGRLPADELYHGVLGTFLDAGFDLVDRRGVRRALVRKALG